jgi:transcriptional regulator GlxA family with amidase domain
MLPKIKKVLQYVDSNPLESVSIDELARLAGLSRSRLCQLFKSEVGMTPGRFIKNARFERARGLLEGTDLSVKQIMMEVGFADPSHFLRDFRKVYGLSPSKYRSAVAHRRSAGSPDGLRARRKQRDSKR